MIEMLSYSISFGEKENVGVVKRASEQGMTVADYIRSLVRIDMEEQQ